MIDYSVVRWLYDKTLQNRKMGAEPEVPLPLCLQSETLCLAASFRMYKLILVEWQFLIYAVRDLHETIIRTGTCCICRNKTVF